MVIIIVIIINASVAIVTIMYVMLQLLQLVTYRQNSSQLLAAIVISLLAVKSHIIIDWNIFVKCGIDPVRDDAEEAVEKVTEFFQDQRHAQWRP